MAYDVALSTTITGQVSMRLRTLAALENRSLSKIVDDLLGQGLPSAAELGRRLSALDAGDIPQDVPAAA